jgi:U32 family peptidase
MELSIRHLKSQMYQTVAGARRKRWIAGTCGHTSVRVTMNLVVPTPPFPHKPEIMSPAGYWPQLHAAIEAGADSVYFGLKHFSARAKVGFALQELPDVFRTLHARGVKGFITFNTLVFEHELSEAARTIAAIAKAGADALIVQDVGVLQLAHEIAPDLELHASTQMSITSAEGVRLAQKLGASRVTLARELSLPEIRAIRNATDCELEIFVHGALCVAYSGQCFSSEAWGGRSANRGQCAQACRLPYELIVDDELRPLDDVRYLLSPGDLYALHHVPEIVDIGISALKIEGRYKDSDYVALTTRAYRQAVDEAVQGEKPQITRTEEIQLEQVYSRGLGAYFISGTNHQEVVEGRTPRHRGVLMGRVVKVVSDSAVLEPASANSVSPLKPGDGVVFDAASWRSPQEREEGGRVYAVSQQRDGNLIVRFGNRDVNFARVRSGDLIWRTHDPDLDKVVRPYLQPAAPVRKQPVHIHVFAREGAPLQSRWTLASKPEISVSIDSLAPLSTASNRALDADFLREQFGRLGATPYALAELQTDIQGSPFAPASILNQVRREAVEQLQARQSLPREHEVHNVSRIKPDTESRPQFALAQGSGGPSLHLLVRTPEQLQAAIESRPASITLDYLDLYGLKPSVENVRSSGISVRVASPRILKPGEERIVDFLLRLDCPLLIRSAGLVDALRDRSHQPITGDFSLNAANSLTADTFVKMGLQMITPTHDLNAAQIADLARTVGADRIEAVAYQHLPVFHTEHCVFCRFLSEGTSYKDCGRPCEDHKIAVRDVSGRAHPVMADIGCRNTVFGAEAQEASLHMDDWRNAGIAHFRLEFVHESSSEVTRVTRAFSDYLTGHTSAGELNAVLQRTSPQGTTEGSLYVPKDYLTLPVLQ